MFRLTLLNGGEWGACAVLCAHRTIAPPHEQGAIDIFNYYDKDHFMKVMPSVDPLDPDGDKIHKVPKEYEILYDPPQVCHAHHLHNTPAPRPTHGVWCGLVDSQVHNDR